MAVIIEQQQQNICGRIVEFMEHWRDVNRAERIKNVPLSNSSVINMFARCSFCRTLAFEWAHYRRVGNWFQIVCTFTLAWKMLIEFRRRFAGGNWCRKRGGKLLNWMQFRRNSSEIWHQGKLAENSIKRWNFPFKPPSNYLSISCAKCFVVVDCIEYFSSVNSQKPVHTIASICMRFHFSVSGLTLRQFSSIIAAQFVQSSFSLSLSRSRTLRPKISAPWRNLWLLLKNFSISKDLFGCMLQFLIGEKKVQRQFFWRKHKY
jgi:hypothetical protein